MRRAFKDSIKPAVRWVACDHAPERARGFFAARRNSRAEGMLILDGDCKLGLRFSEPCSYCVAGMDDYPRLFPFVRKEKSGWGVKRGPVVARYLRLKPRSHVWRKINGEKNFRNTLTYCEL